MDVGELTTKLQNLYNHDPDALTDKELFNHTTQIEELTATVAAQGMRFQAASHQRKAYKSRHYRSTATGISANTRLSRATCGRHTNHANAVRSAH